MAEEIEQVLGFWLNEVGPDRWYKKDEAVDRQIEERFGELMAAAAAGQLDRWAASARGALALVLLLDQFPRNVHRGSARAYASDRHALAVAKGAISRGLDRGVEEPARQFFYLPLMHSESLQDQERCVRMILLRLPEKGEDNLDHAVRHREVIRRFGRFPSRNEALGRSYTKAEREYREDGGYMA